MSEKNTGGPAFPNTIKVEDEAYAELRGMTLRDYFAAKALQAYVTNSEGVHVGAEPTLAAMAGPNAEAYMDSLAALSYRMADAMLKAREA